MNRLLASVFALLLSAQVFSADLLDANAASEAELAAVAGLDAKAVKTILDARPYATIGDLDKALAAVLGEAERESVYAELFVPINLNTATRENILLIPGVGRRMAHEFEEYRPYTSMQQFRREMAKYVDDDEVSRLEMYVTLD